MAKLEEKYTYEVHMEKLRVNVSMVKELYTSIKDHFIELELKINQVNEIMKEIDGDEFEIEIIPVKKESTQWVNYMKNKLKQLRKRYGH